MSFHLDETEAKKLYISMGAKITLCCMDGSLILHAMDQLKTKAQENDEGDMNRDRLLNEIQARTANMVGKLLTELQKLGTLLSEQIEGDRVEEWHNTAMEQGETMSNTFDWEQFLIGGNDDRSLTVSPCNNQQETAEMTSPRPDEQGESETEADKCSSPRPKRNKKDQSAKASSSSLLVSKQKRTKKKRVAAKKQNENLSPPQVDTIEEGRQIVHSISTELSSHPVAVRSIQVADFIIPQLEAIFDPQDPQFSLIPSLAKNLVGLLQNLSRYMKKLQAFEVACDTDDKFKTVLMSIDSSAAIGTILGCIDQKRDSESTREEIASVSNSLKDLKSALRRAELGSIQWRKADPEMSKSDTKVMKDLITLRQPVENILFHCLSVLVVIDGVEPNVDLELLYGNSQDLFQDAVELCRAVNPDEDFDEQTVLSMSMREFREQVLLPAQSIKSKEYLAAKVARDMSHQLTDMRGGDRKSKILPLFEKALGKSVEGEEVDSTVDYCGSDNGTHKKRRKKMTSLVYVLSIRHVIESHLPKCIFPYGFGHSILVQSPSFIRDVFNFPNVKQSNLKFDQFFKRNADGGAVVHDEDSDKVTGIVSCLTDWSEKHTKQIVIVDSKSTVYLKAILE
eukprot:scaffold7863_cov37-Cyclotella_meneghiniana.AAC.7